MGAPRMLDPDLKIALFAEATLGLLNAKMTEGVIRYGANPVVAVIDSRAAGRSAGEFFGVGHDIPVVATLDDAIARGAQVLVLGTAPSGGRLPPDWHAMLDRAVTAACPSSTGCTTRWRRCSRAGWRRGNGSGTSARRRATCRPSQRRGPPIWAMRGC
jgi:hypothetical protein